MTILGHSFSAILKCDLQQNLTIFTARRYASAVLAVIVCLSVRLSVRPSVRLSVRHKSELYKDD